jgi:hypothetical protein
MIQELPHFRKPPCMKFNEIGPATRPATKPQTTVNAVTTRPVNQRDDVQRILEIYRKPGRNFTSLLPEDHVFIMGPWENPMGFSG